MKILTIVSHEAESIKENVIAPEGFHVLQISEMLGGLGAGFARPGAGAGPRARNGVLFCCSEH